MLPSPLIQKKPMSRHLRAFTLLEIMIALTLLSLISAISAVHINKLINAHRFESEISHLFIDLQEAQVLSAAYQTDIALDLYRDKGKLCYRFSTHEPFTTKQLNQETVRLNNTDSIKFQRKKINVLHLNIFSGRIEPCGIVTFMQTPKEGSKMLWFDLQYGRLIKFFYHKPALAKQKIPVQP